MLPDSPSGAFALCGHHHHHHHHHHHYHRRVAGEGRRVGSTTVSTADSAPSEVSCGTGRIISELVQPVVPGATRWETPSCHARSRGWLSDVLTWSWWALFAGVSTPSHMPKKTRAVTCLYIRPMAPSAIRKSRLRPCYPSRFHWRLEINVSVCGPHVVSTKREDIKLSTIDSELFYPSTNVLLTLKAKK